MSVCGHFRLVSKFLAGCESYNEVALYIRTSDSYVISVRYRESTASFAALATQSSLLSQSDSALYDKDHPAMGGKGKQTFVFHETRPDVLASMRERLGLKEWSIKSADGETTSS